jgi:hypothetical protein
VCERLQFPQALGLRLSLHRHLLPPPLLAFALSVIINTYFLRGDDKAGMTSDELLGGQTHIITVYLFFLLLRWKKSFPDFLSDFFPDRWTVYLSGPPVTFTLVQDGDDGWTVAEKENFWGHEHILRKQPKETKLTKLQNSKLRNPRQEVPYTQPETKDPTTNSSTKSLMLNTLI